MAMPQRQVYHCIRSPAAAQVPTGTVGSRTHALRSTPAGGALSRARTPYPRSPGRGAAARWRGGWSVTAAHGPGRVAVRPGGSPAGAPGRCQCPPPVAAPESAPGPVPRGRRPEARRPVPTRPAAAPGSGRRPRTQPLPGPLPAPAAWRDRPPAGGLSPADGLALGGLPAPRSDAVGGGVACPTRWAPGTSPGEQATPPARGLGAPARCCAAVTRAAAQPPASPSPPWRDAGCHPPGGYPALPAPPARWPPPPRRRLLGALQYGVPTARRVGAASIQRLHPGLIRNTLQQRDTGSLCPCRRHGDQPPRPAWIAPASRTQFLFRPLTQGTLNLYLLPSIIGGHFRVKKSG